ncbi:MAG: allophanate hydrolase [Pseudomonadales bacterium]|nr:allophanate hydrolase [Pseudomonadales bacterium]
MSTSVLDSNELDLSFAGLKAHYQAGDFTPRECIYFLHQQSLALNQDNPIYIQLLSLDTLDSYLSYLDDKDPNELPLYGVPFAIKDNIDLARIATTAGCAEYAYTPEDSAFVVQQLIKAGAIPMGKTNLDQFATGLVGTRSPWGAVKNSFNPDYISGGSSAGSAVAVALGLVSFALGTDTAGSGRVPAALNNLVGLKTSRGIFSNQGVVPACKSLDCVTVFALHHHDAKQVLSLAAVADPKDAFSRSFQALHRAKRYPEQFRFAVPLQKQRLFFDDAEYAAGFEQAIEQLQAIGGSPVEIDIQPLLDAALLLYQGPWVAERVAAVGDFIQAQPDAALPVIQTIIGQAPAFSAVDFFNAEYQMQGYRQYAQAIFNQVDVLLTPTLPKHYTIAELDAEPILYNSHNGLYTNFVNLLDLAAIALPSGFTADGLPFGISLSAPALDDFALLALAERFCDANALPMGALARPYPKQSTAIAKACEMINSDDFIDVAVCGAHLSGFPLNHQLTDRGACLIASTKTSEAYKLYALAGGPPYRPGLIRDAHNGVQIEVEVWRMPSAQFGSFVAGIPAPLGIGKVELSDQQWVCSFICEPYAIETAEDISEYGGWRSYQQS